MSSSGMSGLKAITGSTERRQYASRNQPSRRTNPDSRLSRWAAQNTGAAVVAVLAQFGDEHARPPPLLAGKTLDLALDAAERLVVVVLPAVNPAHGADLSAVAGKHLFERVGDLADRRPRAGRLDRQCQEVAFAALRRLGQRGERGIHPALVAQSAAPLEPLDLPVAPCGGVDIEHLDRGRLCRAVYVHPDDRLCDAFAARLTPRGSTLAT